MKLAHWFSGSGRSTRKTLTAVLCNYNHASTLERSLRVYLTQTRRPDRLIVWDDCSSDESMQIIEEVCRGHPWVETVRNAKNVGHLSNCTMALQTCETDYIYFGASDDLVYKDFFRCAMSLLEQHPEAGMFCSNYAIRDIRSNSITNYTIPLGEEARFIGKEDFLDIVQNEYTFVFPSHTVILKVEELLKAGGFVSGFGARIDWFYQLVIAFRTGVVFSPKVTAQYSVGQGQSFSGAHLANESTDHECLVTMLDLLSSTRYQDVCDKFFVPAILRGAPRMLPRLAGIIHSEEKYASFKRYSIIRETVALKPHEVAHQLKNKDYLVKLRQMVRVYVTHAQNYLNSEGIMKRQFPWSLFKVAVAGMLVGAFLVLRSGVRACRRARQFLRG